MIEFHKHFSYFHNFWIKYTSLKKEYQRLLYIRKMYINILISVETGCKSQMKWLDKNIHKHIKQHNILVESINRTIHEFKKYLVFHKIDFNCETYPREFFEALHGVGYHTDTEDSEDEYKCMYSSKDLCDFVRPNYI